MGAPICLNTFSTDLAAPYLLPFTFINYLIFSHDLALSYAQ